MKFKDAKPDELFHRPFLSPLEMWINKMVNFIRSHFGLPNMRILIQEDGSISYTDGLDVTVGARTHLLSLGKDTKETIALLRGIVLHEVSHILYTFFDEMKESREALEERGKLIPEPVAKCSVEDHLEEYPHHAFAMASLRHTLLNIIEDGRIEYLAFENLQRFGGFIAGLKFLRKKHWEKMKTVQETCAMYDAMPESKAKTSFASDCVMSFLLQLAKYGKLKGVEEDFQEWDHFLLKKIPEVTVHVNKAVAGVTADTVLRATNEVFAILFEDYFRPLLQDAEQIVQEMMQQSESEEILAEGVREEAESALGSILSQLPEQLENSSSTEEQSESTEAVKQQASDKRKESGQTADENAESIAKSRLGTPRQEDVEAEDETEQSEEMPKDTEIERVATTSIWAGNLGGIEYGEADEKNIQSLDLDAIGRIRKAAENHSDVRDYDAALQIPELDYGHCHDGIQILVRRPVMNVGSEVLKTTYATFDDYITAGQNAAKILKPYLFPEQKAAWAKNRYYGSRFNAGSAYNPNLRHFSKRVASPKTPSLSVAILIDESGSMYGDKIQAAQATAILLYEMCVALDVPFAVFGHAADGESHITIRNYCFFGEKEPNAKYRMLSVRAHNAANRDGAALRYVAEQLSRQKTDRKLLFIISDGQPNHWSDNGAYCGTAAEEDIRTVVKDYRNRKVAIVAAAIDQDKERIQGIYGDDRFLRIDFLEDLPKELLSIIRRNLFY